MSPARVLTSPLLTRRAEICRTAAQIFRERGYDATSVSDIARALGITKAGLYHYFESKRRCSSRSPPTGWTGCGTT